MAIRRRCALVTLALLASAAPHITHLGRAHYFYTRSAFAARHRARPNAPYGGPVTYLIFWGWSGSADAPAGSSWLNTVTQYYQNVGTTQYITNPAGGG